MIKLIVGLGNPGPQYEHTRHNVGFWFIDQLAKCFDGKLLEKSKLSSQLVQADIHGHMSWLCKPTTFVNLSGRSVSLVTNYYRIQPNEVLVVFDDLDLPAGKLRLRKQGGHGGHNGMRDIINALGTNDFARLRIGIGHPNDSSLVTNYVLSKPPVAEHKHIMESINHCITYIDQILTEQFSTVQNALN